MDFFERQRTARGTSVKLVVLFVVAVLASVAVIDVIAALAMRGWPRDSVVVVPVRGWVDPSLRGSDIPQFDLTLIAPENYASADHPWSHRLDAFLEPVWEYRHEGRRMAALYRVRADAR